MPSKRKARSSSAAVKPVAAEPAAAKPATDGPAAGSEPMPAKPPTNINPYLTLDVERDASEAQIKSAYRKAALKHHPDKAPEADRPAAHVRFQEIALAYAVLSDARRRARYDATGRLTDSIALGDDEDGDGEFAWSDFYRAQFAEVITEDAVRKFKAEFQGSEEEKLAVLAAYVTGEGDMDFLFEEVMLSDPVADEERFRAIIDHEIAEQRVEAYAAYVGETKAAKKRRRAKAEREARLAEEAARELGVDDKLFGNGTGKKGRKSADKNDQSGLAALIQTRQKERAADFFADLEAKYAPAPKKGKRRAVEEPPEEAFERTEKRRKRSKVVDDEEEAVPAPSPRKAKRVKA